MEKNGFRLKHYSKFFLFTLMTSFVSSSYAGYYLVYSNCNSCPAPRTCHVFKKHKPCHRKIYRHHYRPRPACNVTIYDYRNTCCDVVRPQPVMPTPSCYGGCGPDYDVYFAQPVDYVYQADYVYQGPSINLEAGADVISDDYDMTW